MITKELKIKQTLQKQQFQNTYTNAKYKKSKYKYKVKTKGRQIDQTLPPQ